MLSSLKMLRPYHQSPINWGLIGIFKFDLVAFLFNEMSTGSRAVYTLVGLAGLYLLIILAQRAVSNQ